MSEFWKRKMRTYFRTFDVDHDGYMSEDDCAELARKFAENERADPEKKEKLIKTFVAVWHKLMKSADRKKENRLTAKILTESIRQQFYDPDMIIALVNLKRGVFELMDVDQDGYLKSDEFKRWYDHQGVPEETFDRRMAFDALDTNRDGKISIEEYISGFFDFLFSQDESSQNKYFFGALVD